MHRRINKKEIIIIIAIITASLMSLLVISLTSREGKTAVITVDNKTVTEASLSGDKGEFTIEGIDDAVFEISNNKIRIKENNCPDKICVNTGWISKTHERIICMPKKLIIEIK